MTGGRCVCLGVAASSQFVVRLVSCSLFLIVRRCLRLCRREMSEPHFSPAVNLNTLSIHTPSQTSVQLP